MSERGKYIVQEGGEFTGKTTQFNLMKSYISEIGMEDSFLYTREPGGTPVGEDIRKILFFPNKEHFPTGALPDRVALQLFTANRLYNWRTQISHALEAGINVYSDRNYYSSVAYQGAYGEVSEDEVIETTAYSMPPEYMYPDIAWVSTIPSEERIRRQKNAMFQDGAMDAFEAQDGDYHDKVTVIYQNIVTKMGAVGIDGTRSVDEIHKEMTEQLNTLLGI